MMQPLTLRTVNSPSKTALEAAEFSSALSYFTTFSYCALLNVGRLDYAAHFVDRDI